MNWIDVVHQRELLETIQQADAEDLGYPEPGVHFGPGPHVELGETPGPGWTINYAPIEPHPVNPQRYGYPVRDGLASRLEGKVPAQALAAIQNAGPKDPSWIPPGLENKEPELFNVREDSK
jgi:hypothetical protein